MLIYRGAEAEIYKEKFLGMPCARKVRKEKLYKQRELDAWLRAARVKAEAKMLARARAAVHTPHVLAVEGETLVIEYVAGKKVKGLFLAGDTRCAGLVGREIRALHDAGIVHNDLTTGNMILRGKALYFIDFGLAQQGSSLEDRAVDLLVFKRMLSSTHYDVFEKAWPALLRGYRPGKALLSKMAEVESRAKYR